MSRTTVVARRSAARSSRRDRAGTLRREAGQALVELALVVTIMIVMALALFDIGRGVHAYLSVIQASRDGARVAMHDGATDDEVAAAANSAASPFATSVTIVRSGGLVRVTVSYDYQPITPFIGALLGGPPLHLTSTMAAN